MKITLAQEPEPADAVPRAQVDGALSDLASAADTHSQLVATPIPAPCADGAACQVVRDAVQLARQVTPSDEVLLQEIGGEAVLLDLASESYFGLDAVGTRIWSLLGDGASLQDVHAALCAEYAAEPERIGRDLLALVAQLADAGLVKVD